ncbi:C4-dicarboxylate TRAP transporter substrate-binding protein [Terasakiella pusilla]|jgi:TRAP-type C4-dicarboxylate transport system substrate-binding protein|uniref:C4-dicarboxylate TRAP transporter substrate-binding protein n=1 Tax=Terasakiella pusilla TaxID=64973 RepID=UPI003AA868AF
MKSLFGKVACTALALTFAGEALATDWNVSVWGKRRAFTEHVEKLAELVEQKSGGSFKLNISYGGLSKNKENLDGISIGAFEMAQFCAGYHRDKNPSLTVAELPFLGVSTLQQERELSQALYKHPAVVKDLARWNATLLMPSPMPQYNVVGVGETPKELSGFKGMSVRATGGIGEAMKALGAIPTSMSATEVRQAMDSGVVTGVTFAQHAHMAFGTLENAKWWTSNLNPGTINCPIVVNTDALNSLSDKEKEILLGSVEESLDHYINNYENKTMKKWGPELETRGIETITYSDEAIADLKKAVAGPAAQQWIEENKAKGLPAQELYDFFTGMIK